MNLQSNFRFAYIVDWIDQAFLHLYFDFKESVEILQSIGIRTALDLVNLKGKQNLISLAATKTKIDQPLLENVIDELEKSPHIKLLKQLEK